MANDIASIYFGDGGGVPALLQRVERPHADARGFAEVLNPVGQGKV